MSWYKERKRKQKMKTLSITKSDYIELQKTNSVIVDKRLVYIANDKTFRYCNQSTSKDNAGQFLFGKSYECKIKVIEEKPANHNIQKLAEIEKEYFLHNIKTDTKDLLAFLNYGGDEEEFVCDETIQNSINLIEKHLMENLKSILEILKRKE